MTSPGEVRDAPLEHAGSDLLERDSEIAQIGRVLDRVAAGEGRRLLIEGPPGVGKSALIDFATARAADREMRVLAAEVAEMDSQVPLRIANDLLDPVGAASTGEPTSPAPDPRAVSARLAQAVVELASEQPVMLVVDGVQWADGGSLRWLAEVARHIDRAPIGLFLTTRPQSPEERGPVLARLLDDRRAVVLRPRPLSSEACAALLADHLGSRPDDELLGAAERATAGNPYLLHVLADGLRQSGAGEGDPVALVREVGSRAVAPMAARILAGLDDDSRTLLEAVATVGDPGDLADLEAITGMDQTRVEDGVHRLAARALLRPDGTIELRHPLLRAAVRDRTASDRREQLLRASARRLADTGRVEEAAARLTELPTRADPDVVAGLRAAAGIAWARGAPDVAAALLRRALAEPPADADAGALRSELGQALLAIGDPAAVEVLERAVAEAPGAAAAAATARALALALVYRLRIPEATEVLGRTAEQLGGSDPALAEELEAQALHYQSLDASLRPQRLRVFERWGESRGASELAYRMRLAELASESLGACRPASEAGGLAERALAGGILLSGAPDAHLSIVLQLGYLGRVPLARTQAQDAISRAREGGQMVLLSFALGIRGELLTREGDLVSAETDLRAALDLVSYREFGTPFIVRPLVEVLLEQDEIASAQAELRRAGLTGELPQMISRAAVLYARGRTHLAAGAAQLALDDLLLAGESLEGYRADSPTAVPWRGAAALALLELGQRDRALALSGEEVTLAEQIGSPETLGAALRTHARALGPDERRDQLKRAVELLESSNARLEHARALVDLGALIRSGGDPAGARELLREGGGLAEDLGAAGTSKRAREELVRAGGRPRRAAARGARALTPTERKVSSLAAQGMTNREIAQVFVLATKTIESHLASAYRKLGIGGRAELGDALGALGEPGVTARTDRSRS